MVDMDVKQKLFMNKEDCCGCGACKNVCRVKAVLMLPDEDGFLYPQINSDLCVNCGLCTRVCSYQQTTELRIPQVAYAATSMNSEMLRRSSSGGIFSVLAKAVLSDGGRVYGAAYTYNQDKELYVSHIGIDSDEELWRLQGSKYAHSDIAMTYREAERDLKAGRKVLFSGTPCQIDGLKGYLRKDYEQLLTVDIICHGVPSSKHLAGYIRYLEGKFRGKVRNLQLRDKAKGWADFFARVDVQRGSRIVAKWDHWYFSAFYAHFLESNMYRENCYSCKYAGRSRCSDITLGDYWGIQKEHPELFSEERWIERMYDGVSCVLINSDRGRKMMESVKDEMDYVVSDIEKASRNNQQLREPACHDGRRETLLARWREGYEYVDQDFRTAMGWRYCKRKLKDLIQPEWKRAVRRMMRRLRKK